MPSETKIHTFKGKYLVGALIEGDSPLGLEKTIEMYMKDGDHNIQFGDIKKEPTWEQVIGVFPKPSAGCLRISHSYDDSPNYFITSESFGDCAIDVLADYAQRISLKHKRSSDVAGDVRKMCSGIQLEEMMLKKVPSAELREPFYLTLLQLTSNICLDSYFAPISSKSPDKYAADNGLDLSDYAQHTVIFKFPSTLDSVIPDISLLMKTGLRQTAPKGTVALTSFRSSVDQGKTEDEFVNIAAAIALVKKD